MNKRSIRILAAILAGLMILSTVAVLVFSGADAALEESGLTLVEMTRQMREAFSKTAANGRDLAVNTGRYEDGDSVKVIVELEDASVLDSIKETPGARFSMGAREKDIAHGLKVKQNKLIERMAKTILGGKKPDVKYQYTLLMNAFCVTTEYGKLDAIEKLEGVKAVYLDTAHKLIEPEISNAVDMTGVDMLHAQGNGELGLHRVIGIIDTGIDTEHEAFATMPGAQKLDRNKVEEILAGNELNAEGRYAGLTADDVYHNAKLPFAFNYYDGDTNVSHHGEGGLIHDHGTHVAGIAAALATDDEGAITFSGVAPKAQIVVFKVFGVDANGNMQGGYDSDIIAALEDALMLGVDVINVSLGWSAALTKHTGNSLMERFDDMVSRVESAGSILVCAAGNEAGAGVGNSTGTNKSTLEHIDNGTVSGPSAYSAALSVASVNNSKRLRKTFFFGGEKIGYNDPINAENPLSSIKRDEAYAYVYCGYGAKGDFSGKKLGGKIALIQRGAGLLFTEKARNAANAGAVAAIIFNNVPGDVNALEKFVIPTVFISKSDGIAMMEANDKEVIITDEIGYAAYPYGGEVSSFSSWGVPADLSLKPDFSAPGGNIYSSTDVRVSKASYAVWSGTSMSTPHVTGAMALLKNCYAEAFEGMTAAAFAQFCISQLMSTSVPLKDADGVYVSPRKQGAGLINVFAASKADIRIIVPGEDRPKLELGDDPAQKGVYTLAFTVKNLSASKLTYDIDAIVLTEKIEEERYLAESAYDITRLCTIQTGQGSSGFTLDAGEEKALSVTVTLGKAAKQYLDKFPSGVYVDGFVRLISKAGLPEETAYSVPFLSFYGDWNTAPMFEEVDYTDVLRDESVGTMTKYPNSAIVYREGMENGFFYLGANPIWDIGGAYIAGRNAISPNDDGFYDTLYDVCLNLMRSAKTVDLCIKDAQTEEIYFQFTQYGAQKALYDQEEEGIIPLFFFWQNGKEAWAGTDQNGQLLTSDTECIVTVSAALGSDRYVSDANKNDAWSFPITIDLQAPEVISAGRVRNNNKTELALGVTDNQFVADVSIYDGAYNMIGGKACAEINARAVSELVFDITDVPDGGIYIVATDYAWNQAVYYFTGEGPLQTVSPTPPPAFSLGSALVDGSPYVLDGGYLRGVAEETTALALLLNFKEGFPIQIVDEKGNEVPSGAAFIGTGYRVRLMDGNIVLDEAAVAVMGDLTGDGRINALDIAQVQKHLLRMETLAGAYHAAADMNGDFAVNSMDIGVIQGILLGK